MKRRPAEPERQRSSWPMLTERVQASVAARRAGDEDATRNELRELAREARLLADTPELFTDAAARAQDDYLCKRHGKSSS